MNQHPNNYEQSSGESTDRIDRLDLNSVRHPEVTVRLSDTDGNAFGILGAVQRSLRQAGVDEAEIETFFDKATSGDYDHLLTTCMAWVNVE